MHPYVRSLRLRHASEGLPDRTVHLSRSGCRLRRTAIRRRPRRHSPQPDRSDRGTVSGSTEAYDRGAKWAQYRQLESLQEYVLVSQTTQQVEVFRRQPNGGWLLSDADGLDAEITLTSVDVPLPLSEIYRKVDQDRRSRRLTAAIVTPPPPACCETLAPTAEAPAASPQSALKCGPYSQSIRRRR